MAKDIRETPVLEGADAELFNLRAKVNEQSKEISRLRERERELVEALDYVKSNLQGAIDSAYSAEEAEQTSARCIEEIEYLLSKVKQ